MVDRETKLRNSVEISELVIRGVPLKHEEKNHYQLHLLKKYYQFAFKHLIWYGTHKYLTVNF